MNLTEKVNQLFVAERLAATGVYWSSVETAVDRPGTDVDLEALRRAMASTGTTDVDFTRDVEQLRQQREKAAEAACLSEAQAALRASMQQGEEAERRCEAAARGVEEANRARDAARSAQSAALYRIELAGHARREKNELEMALAERGYRAFAHVAGELARAESDAEQQRFEAHQQQMALGAANERAEVEAGLAAARAVAAPGTWIDGADVAEAAHQLRASSSTEPAHVAPVASDGGPL